MFLITFGFLAFLAVSLVCYYLMPGKVQWLVLLAASLVFYMLAGTPYTVVYLLLSIVSVWAAANDIEKHRGDAKRCKRVLVLAILLNVGMLTALKYTNFFILNFKRVSGLFGMGESIQTVRWAASLGISFYTLMALSYVLDVYWETSRAQKNIAKVALYLSFFPQMSSGPISRYHEVSEQLYAPHKFDYTNFCHGLQRLLIGFIKKLVIAENLLLLVDPIFDVNAQYNGGFIWIGMIFYLTQLYMDFSGCMDIVLGAAQCFGIALPENFDRPFHSRSIQEFWKRWHITLGAWAQDYIMYPVLRSRAWSRMQRKLKKRFGKKAAKQVPAWIAMLILWCYMGLWHGGAWRYVTEMLWFWVVIVSGQFFAPQLKILMQKLKIDPESGGWHRFQSVRTALIFGMGVVFFRAQSVRLGFRYLKSAFSPRCLAISNFMMQLEVYLAGFDRTELLKTIVCAAAGMVFALVLIYFQAKEKSFYEWLGQRNLVLRWAVLYLMIFTVLLFGVYGPEYNASQFIYGGF